MPPGCRLSPLSATALALGGRLGLIASFGDHTLTVVTEAA
jgi:hypothetical protein